VTNFLRRDGIDEDNGIMLGIHRIMESNKYPNNKVRRKSNRIHGKNENKEMV